MGLELAKPGGTPFRMAAAAFLCTIIVYSNSLLNGWAGDDVAIVLENVRVHSIRGALGAWWSPYWPPPAELNGLYRPFTILTYAVDWAISGGRPWFFHLDNVLLHAVATSLVVLLALAWVPPLGALVAGLVFAVHPVHVEAVSNVVGRAELLVACAVLGAVVCARRYRTSPRPGPWLLLVLVLALLGMLSKEHGVIVAGAIALDHWLDRRPAARSSVPLYAGLAVLTVAWLFTWHGLVGRYVGSLPTSSFFGMTGSQRLSMMLPAQFTVLRLLVWPSDLSPDYSPQVIPVPDAWGPAAVGAIVVVGAILALAVLLARRAPAVTFGILLAVLAYAPTANFLFPSGVVLAERALYLAVLAPALALAWVLVTVSGNAAARWVRLAVIAGLVVFSARTWQRTPFWKDAMTGIIEDVVDHMENYRSRLHLGELFESRRDSARALAEFLAAGAINDRDPRVAQFVVRAALAVRRPGVAVAEAERARRLAPDDYQFARLLADTRVRAGRPGEAIAGARADVLASPASLSNADVYMVTLRDAGAPRWAVFLAEARFEALAGRAASASDRLDSALAATPRPPPPGFCEELRLASAEPRVLDGSKVTRLSESAEGCQGTVPPL